jgi:hypothetical protein
LAAGPLVGCAETAVVASSAAMMVSEAIRMKNPPGYFVLRKE